MTKIIVVLLVGTAITGCVSNTGVVPMGQDTYMISYHGTGIGPSSSASRLKADIFRDGTAYCTSQGKEFQPINSSGADGAYGRREASAEVQFRCLTKGDPELGRPTMKPVANVRIESDIREKKDIQIHNPGDMYTELRKLKELLDTGVITQSEFDTQKTKIMSKY